MSDDYEYEAPLRRSVEEWSKEKGTSEWAFAAAKHLLRWPIGQQVTEAEYDAAIARTLGIRSR